MVCIKGYAFPVHYREIISALVTILCLDLGTTLFMYNTSLIFLGAALHGADIGGGGEGDLQDLPGVLEQPGR